MALVEIIDFKHEQKVTDEITFSRKIEELAEDKLIAVEFTNGEVALIKKVYMSGTMIYRPFPIKNTNGYYTNIFDALSVEECLKNIISYSPKVKVAIINIYNTE